MAEVVGLVASVVQLAGAGLKLSQTLYQYADGVASADRRIKDIANEVKLTSFVIQELGTIFEKDETANLISENAVRTANETIKECFAVFTELELKINKGKPGKMGRLMLPFRDNKIELLRSQIDKLKSTLELLMQVLIHAHQVSSEKYNREAEAKHREEIKQLLENKKQATKKYEESLRNFSISDGSTAVDDGDRSLQDKDDIGPSSDLFNTAGAIGSTINPDTLATCVDHVRSLLADIETLQLALAEQVNGDDHSDHHQKAIGSYFLARSHLDSVLLGNSQANVTDAKIRQSISKTRTNTSTMVSDAARVEPPKRPHPAVLRDERSRKEMVRSSKLERKREERNSTVYYQPPDSSSSSSVSTATDREPPRRRRSVFSYDERVREELMMAQGRQRARIVAEAKAKSNSMPESSYRTARKIVNDSRRHPAYRPSVRAESIEDVPLYLPPGAECRRTKYSEEYVPSRRTHTVEQPRKSRLTASDKSELDGGYRTNRVSGKKKGNKGRTEVVPASLPEPRRTSSRVNAALQESSDNGFEAEVPERITSRRRRLQFSDVSSRAAAVQQQSLSPAKLAKVEARTRGESLWREELSRRVLVGESTKAGVESQCGSYQSQSLPQRQSVRQSSVRRPTVTQESTERRRKDLVKIDQDEPRVPDKGLQSPHRTQASGRPMSYSCEDQLRSDERERMQRVASMGLGAAEIGYRRLPPSSSPRHRSPRSRSHSPRDHRYYDSDSSGYVSYSEKIEREQERDRIKDLEEQSRRDWASKPKKKGSERERGKERRAPVAHTSNLGSDAKREGEQLNQPLSAFERHFERQRQDSSEEEHTSPIIQEGTSEAEEDGGSWDYIEEIEDVSRADEVDELLREWTTLLG